MVKLKLLLVEAQLAGDGDASKGNVSRIKFTINVGRWVLWQGVCTLSQSRPSVNLTSIGAAVSRCVNAMKRRGHYS